MDKEAQYLELSKKYNLQALNDYNFDNFTFDINLGEVTEKDLDKMKKEEAEYNEELKKEEEEEERKKNKK
jgi:hypothetical protein